MKSVNKSSLAAAIVAALTLIASTAWAVDLSKPSAVISFGGYKKTVDDLNALGQVVGQPGMGSGADMMLKMMVFQGKEAAFDLSQPCGMVSYYSEAVAPGRPAPFFIFLPVPDMQKFVTIMEGAGFQSKELGENHYQFTSATATSGQDDPMFAKHQGKWLFIAPKELPLDNLPSDPVSLLDGLDKKYLLAVQVYGQNQGIKWLEKSIGEGIQGAQTASRMMATGGMPMGEQPPAAPQPSLAQLGPVGMMLQQMGDQIDTLTLGFMFDKNGSTMTDLQLDLTVTAMSGTELHKKIGQAGEMTSQFAGFYDTKKAIALTATSKGTDETLQQLKQFTNLFQMQAIQGLSRHDLSEDELAMAKDGITRLAKVMNATIEQGKLDLGVQFQYVPEHSTVLFGIKVVEGQELEEIVRQASENQLFADDEGTMVTIVRDVDSLGDIKFHKFQPFPPSPMFGSSAELVVGISNEAFYVGVGTNPVKKLKEAIQKSQSMGTEKQPMAQISLDIPKILQLINNRAPEGQAPIPPKVLEAFGKKPGNTASLKVIPVQNGLSYQLEIAPNIVKTLMQGAQGMMPGMMPGGGMPGGGMPGGGMPGGMPPGGMMPMPSGGGMPSGGMMPMPSGGGTMPR